MGRTVHKFIYLYNYIVYIDILYNALYNACRALSGSLPALKHHEKVLWHIPHEKSDVMKEKSKCVSLRI